MDLTRWTGTVAGATVALAALGGAWRARGTTAVPAAWWAVAAGAALAAERYGAGEADLAAAACRRLALVALGICPALSLLGAKRPQHGVWQAIVAAAAVVIALPAATALLVRPGAVPDVPVLLRLLVGVLIVVGWLNHAATRRGIPVAAIALGQGLLALPCLTGFGNAPPEGRDAVAAALIAAGAIACAVWPAAGGTRDLDRAWLAFRETFGAAWTLRVAERFNATARREEWPVQLSWSGPEETARGGLDACGDARRSLVALLRRFVGRGWLVRHGLLADGVGRGSEAGR